jgi:hypothetical protein
VFLKERELAHRWQTSLRTLQRWRALEAGPPFHRIGGVIRYRVEDIVAFEEIHRMAPGSAAPLVGSPSIQSDARGISEQEQNKYTDGE